MFQNFPKTDDNLAPKRQFFLGFRQKIYHWLKTSEEKYTIG